MTTCSSAPLHTRSESKESLAFSTVSEFKHPSPVCGICERAFSQLRKPISCRKCGQSACWSCCVAKNGKAKCSTCLKTSSVFHVSPLDPIKLDVLVSKIMEKTRVSQKTPKDKETLLASCIAEEYLSIERRLLDESGNKYSIDFTGEVLFRLFPHKIELQSRGQILAEFDLAMCRLAVLDVETGFAIKFYSKSNVICKVLCKTSAQMMDWVEKISRAISIVRPASIHAMMDLEKTVEIRGKELCSGMEVNPMRILKVVLGLDVEKKDFQIMFSQGFNELGQSESSIAVKDLRVTKEGETRLICSDSKLGVSWQLDFDHASDCQTYGKKLTKAIREQKKAESLATREE